MSSNRGARFRDFVALNLQAHKVLPETDERDLIGNGIAAFKLDGAQARGMVAVMAGEGDRILASDVSRSMLNVLHQLGGKRGAIGKRQFDKAVVILKALVKGHITDAHARAWVKRLVEQGEFKIRGRGLFRRRRWFRKIKPVA